MYQQKNQLKNLIYIQENKACNEQTIKGLFRSIAEPILENNVEGVVFCRLEEKSKNDFSGLLKRLEYCNSKIYDFSDTSISDKFQNILKEKIWDKTEFLYVLSERYGAVLIFDYEEGGIKDFAQMYILHHSKNLTDAFNIISANSTVDISEYQEKWHPERRENGLMNSSIRKIVESLNETNQEILISEMAQQSADEQIDCKAELDFITAKSGFIAHEMRNLLSICNLYSTIIGKRFSEVEFRTDEAKDSIINARECITRAMHMMSNSLVELRSMTKVELKEYSLGQLINSALELGHVYANGKDIKFIDKTSDENVLVDEEKFLAVIINLIKNAVESIENMGEIVIETKVEKENIKLSVSNNGKPIAKELQSKIFEKGFTTKATGSGLGLVICKKTLEEQGAQLRLKKSDEISTEFEITLLKGEESL